MDTNTQAQGLLTVARDYENEGQPRRPLWGMSGNGELWADAYSRPVADRLAAAWNACDGLSLSQVQALGPGGVDTALDLLRQLVEWQSDPDRANTDASDVAVMAAPFMARIAAAQGQ